MKKLPLKGLIPNSSYSVSLRGKDASGNYTAWSKFVTFTTLADTLAPSTPVAPTVSLSGPQNIIIEHTLNTTGSGKLEPDVVYLEVQTSDSTDSYATTINIGNIPVGPLSSAGVSQRFVYPAPSYNNNVFVKARVRAIDRSGNQSAWSAWSSPSSTIPYFDAAYIGSLTVDSLSAEKITSGTLGLVNTAADTKLSIGDNSTYIMLRNNHLTGSTSPKGQMYIATTGTPANPTGATGSGYRDINTKFYVDSTGKFSLGTGLYWDGSGLTLTGAVTATSGTFTGTVNATGGDFTSYVTAGGTSIGKNWTVSSGGGDSSISGTFSGIKINDRNFFGVNASNSNQTVFSAGTTGSYVQWNGTQLDVKGRIVATGGSFTSYMTAGNVYLGNGISIVGTDVSGTYNGLYVNPYNFFAESGGTTKFQVGDQINYMRWTGSALEIAGSLTSTATITGGTIKTSGSSNYVSISSSDPTKVVFGISGTTSPGYLQIWSGLGFSGLELVAAKTATYPNELALRMDNLNGIYIDGLQHTTGANTKSIRNIWTAVSQPLNNDGVPNGDIWLVYV